MTPLARNLTARRESLGLTVREVQEELNRRGYDVPYPTVAGWFNGNRGVRSMENLKALCAVLQTDLDSLHRDEIEFADGPIEATVIREIRELEPGQKELVLAVIRGMKGKGQ
jgi:transcriptional regulator with XRE-family HTH domain